ncbi:hypothetical protein P692DRAFT_20728967 [Suillus brevipes Sb2]|nr:hypothetical protein P692DRAFT_20728967 [Suillus brevipes Sb2]
MTTNPTMIEREKFFEQVPVFRRHFTSHPRGWSGYAVHSVSSIYLTSLLARFSVLLSCFRHSMKTARKPPFLVPFLGHSEVFNADTYQTT